MDPAIWIPIAATVGGLILGVHQYMRNQEKRLEKKIDDRIQKCVSAELKPLADDLNAIKTKMDNGVLHASKEHTAAIGNLQVDVGKLTVNVNHIANDVGNLSRQIEAVLVGKGNP